MSKIAIVTCSKFPNLIDDESSLPGLLNNYGIEAKPAVWDDPYIKWNNFDAVIIRNTWDYFYKPDEFIAWLGKIEKTDAQVFNPIKTIRENLHKFYLNKLQENGILVVPTEFIKKSVKVSLKEITENNGWEKFIIKPAVSAAALNTFLFNSENYREAQIKFDELIKTQDMLIQKYMKSIEGGEWSLIFFDNVYSHSILKLPKDKDFRVQEVHGGRVDFQNPPENIIRQAQEIVDKQKEKLLYSRVDGVIENGKFYLMELELIEPELFFRGNEEAMKRFARAIKERVNAKIKVNE